MMQARQGARRWARGRELGREALKALKGLAVHLWFNIETILAERVGCLSKKGKECK